MKLNEIKLLKESFPTNRVEIEKILNDLEIENYTIHPNGVVDVVGNINLSFRELSKIPVQFGKVTGDFYCYNNKLTSLEGCPTSVGGDFSCYDNQLSTLRGCPIFIGRDFYCYNNKLTSLEGCPTSVGGDFSCNVNQLSTLRGCPTSVGGSFYCSKNKLTTLEGINDLIDKIGGSFVCVNNKIKTGGLGLVLINGIPNISISFADILTETIIRKYLGRPDDIFECQNELIESGLEEYAKL